MNGRSPLRGESCRPLIRHRADDHQPFAQHNDVAGPGALAWPSR